MSMSKTGAAVELARCIAADPRHGYDQQNRWGPDYDCSSLLITVWEQAGVPVRTAGATYTGNMRDVFLRCGFEDVTGLVSLGDGRGLLAGDVLLNAQRHTAMMVDRSTLVQASINEHGSTTGGETGDQTGGEIALRGYYNYPWDCVLRYREGAYPGAENAAGGAQTPAEETVQLRTPPLLRRGSAGDAVRAVQYLLLTRGLTLPRCGADGDFGAETEAAVRAFQRAAGLETDGECGPLTWEALTREADA